MSSYLLYRRKKRWLTKLFKKLFSSVLNTNQPQLISSNLFCLPVLFGKLFFAYYISNDFGNGPHFSFFKPFYFSVCRKTPLYYLYYRVAEKVFSFVSENHRIKSFLLFLFFPFAELMFLVLLSNTYPIIFKTVWNNLDFLEKISGFEAED